MTNVTPEKCILSLCNRVVELEEEIREWKRGSGYDTPMGAKIGLRTKKLAKAEVARLRNELKTERNGHSFPSWIKPGARAIHHQVAAPGIAEEADIPCTISGEPRRLENGRWTVRITEPGIGSTTEYVSNLSPA